MSSPEKPPLVVLLGPTAVGKTALSLELAEQLNGEIVSADSRLFYRGMDIGTAKPSPAERQRIPHHLIDVSPPDDTWSLTRFQQAARAAIDAIHARGRLPFLVGGTGQYIQAIVQGWQPPRVQPHPRLRSTLESLVATREAQGQNGKRWLYQSLQRLDPIAAQNIEPRNLRRIIRALEVILTSGQPFSAQKRRGTVPYRILQIGLIRPRPALYARVDERIEAMFAAGLLDEVRALLAAGYSPELPSMSSIGYRECVAVLRGEMSLEEAKAQMRRQTRAFIRRQANWFKANDPNIHWLDAAAPDLKTQAQQLILHFLAT